MNQYETGAKHPKFDTAVKIAKALGVPTSYLYEPDEVIAKIILDLGNMSSQDRKAVSDFSAKRAKLNNYFTVNRLNTRTISYDIPKIK